MRDSLPLGLHLNLPIELAPSGQKRNSLLYIPLRRTEQPEASTLHTRNVTSFKEEEGGAKQRFEAKVS